MIPARFYYLVSLVLIFIIPTIVAGIFVWQRIPLLNLVVFAVLISIIGSVWDIWATRHGKKDGIWLWQFNTHDTMGIRFLGLPVEEYLFYVCTSFYVVFMWEAIRYALESQDLLFFILVPCLALWSVIFISVPYLARVKGDRLQ